MFSALRSEGAAPGVPGQLWVLILQVPPKGRSCHCCIGSLLSSLRHLRASSTLTEVSIPSLPHAINAPHTNRLMLMEVGGELHPRWTLNLVDTSGVLVSHGFATLCTREWANITQPDRSKVTHPTAVRHPGAVLSLRFLHLNDASHTWRIFLINFPFYYCKAFGPISEELTWMTKRKRWLELPPP